MPSWLHEGTQLTYSNPQGESQGNEHHNLTLLLPAALLPISNEDQPIGRKFASAEQRHLPRPLTPIGCTEEAGERNPKVPFATSVQTEIGMDHHLTIHSTLLEGRSGKGWGRTVFLKGKSLSKQWVEGKSPPLTGSSHPLPCPPATCLPLKKKRCHQGHVYSRDRIFVYVKPAA